MVLAGRSDVVATDVIVACSTKELVVTAVTGKRVVTRSAIQVVVAMQDAGKAARRVCEVVDGVAGEYVVAIAAGDLVVTRFAEGDIVARPAVQPVLSGSAKQPVVAAAPQQDVISALLFGDEVLVDAAIAGEVTFGIYLAIYFPVTDVAHVLRVDGFVAAQDVVPSATHEDVVSGTTDQGVPAFKPNGNVVAFAAIQQVAFVGAVDLEVVGGQRGFKVLVVVGVEFVVTGASQ